MYCKPQPERRLLTVSLKISQVAQPIPTIQVTSIQPGSLCGSEMAWRDRDEASL